MSDHRDHEPPSAMDRREFLRLAGASIALAGLDGCTRLPAENILPYVDNRPELTPGLAQYYATAMCVDGCATGLLVESHVGRPTKIEGNPDHPASLGASGPLEQASVLQLYDPDRAKAARIGAKPADWSAVAATLAPAALGARVGARGKGLRVLIDPSSSPLDESLLARLLDAHPDATVHMYSPFAPERAGGDVVRHYDVALADVIVGIDTDFLASGPFNLRYARRFADNRRIAGPSNPMNRLYVIESGFTSTGIAADHRFAVRPRDIPTIAQAVLAAVKDPNARPSAPAWVGAIARDLVAHRGRAVVIARDAAPDVRAAADDINEAIGAFGHTAWFTPSPLIGRTVRISPLADLIDALGARAVDTLIIVGGNPSYATPALLGLSSLIRAVPNAGYVGLYENETARDVRWFVPMSHYLESWGDARAYDGTLSIVQPLVNPLYASITPAELYATLAGQPARAYELLRGSWGTRVTDDSHGAWADALERGVVAGSAFPPTTTRPPTGPAESTPPNRSDGTIDVVFAADPKIHDGAFANNAWLQELPSTITQLTWGNAALVSRATAHRIGITTGDGVKLSAGDRRIDLPALVVPGHADETVTLHCGYGRTGAETVARHVGVNAFAFLPALFARTEYGVSIAAAGPRSALAVAQTQPTMEASHPVRSATLAEYRAAPSSVGIRPERVLSLYPEPAPPVGPHGSHQWAMTIDLATCIGCGACVVACQAENNIPVVGASEVKNARIMHWMRIDRYFGEHESAVDALLQPMLCQHCERAPCEYVCPVEATVHSPDGLNEMVYNRCVGTRFCSNNCPYKVRRFNWFDYNKDLSETEVMVKNPNVTVRERGVMEKCTFCVQRIREAEIAAARDGREARGSQIQTACQQSCPTNAIVFGSLTEPDSEMVRRRDQPRAYSALHDLGTRPRVQYLARIRNTNPDIAGGV